MTKFIQLIQENAILGQWQVNFVPISISMILIFATFALKY